MKKKNTINYLVKRILKPIFYLLTQPLSDRAFLQLSYFLSMRKRLNLINPKTFNEKLQWLKLYDRKPEYTTMVDKIEAKEWVANIIGREHIIPTLGVWERVEDIDFDALPNKFVLKTNHDSGTVIICTDKSKLDKKKAVTKLQKSLRRNFFNYNREWAYKNVPHKIFAEEYMVDESGYELKDYKFFCFNGKVKFFKVDFGRYIEHHANYYSPDGILQKFGEAAFPPDPTYKIELPKNLDKMIAIAENLAQNKYFLRVDIYNINGGIYFGELTFYPASGIGKWTSDEADRTIGNYLRLPISTLKEQITRIE